MTTIPTPDEYPCPSLDPLARQLHALALAQVAPHTLARLRDGRHAARAAGTPRHRPAFASWLAGGALAASLALAVVLRPGSPPAAPAPARVADATLTAPASEAVADDPAAPLQDDPGFYVWLGSLDSNAIAME